MSAEKVTLLTDLAESFNATDPEVDGQCVRITIYRVASGLGASQLAEGWSEVDTGAPAPVLWSPSSSAWGAVVNYRLSLAGQAPMANDFERIMITPLVLAMPRPMAEALGWPEAEIGWADVLSLSQNPEGWGAYGHPEWGQFKLGKTNPNFSTSGLSATAAIYYAATGKTSGLTLDDIGSSRTADFVRGVEAATVHYGDTTMTFLENMLREDLAGRPLTYVSAVAIEEVSIIAYNRGDPGDVGLEDPTPPNVPLVAIYPKEGTLFSDNPAYVLDASWVSDVQRQAALDFRSFVIDDPANQARALDFGFRPGNPAVAGGRPDLHGQRPEPVAAQDRTGTARPGGAGRPGGLLGVVPQDGAGDHRVRRQRVDGRPGRRGLHQARPGQAGGARLARPVQARGRGGPLDLLHRTGRRPRLPGAAAAHAAVRRPGADRERRSPASSR